MKRSDALHIADRITEYSLYLLVFCIPFSKSLAEISIAAAIFAWLSRKIIGNDLRLKKTPINVFLFAFVAANLLSLINAGDKFFVARSIVTKCLKYAALYFVVVETVDSRPKLKNILKAALFSATVVMVDAYIQYRFMHVDPIRLYPSFKYVLPWSDFHLSRLGFPVPSPYFLGFPTGPFPFPNDLSAWMLIIAIPAICLLLWQPEGARARVLLGLFLLPFLFLFYLANTRSAWAGFFVSLFAMLFIKKAKLLIVAVLCLVVAASFFVPKQKLNDLLGFSSMQDRFYMWRIGWKIFLDHPVIGNGCNTFFTKFMEFREDEYKEKKGSYAHNSVLQMAAETGAIGLGAFLAMLLALFGRSFRYAGQNGSTFAGVLALGISLGLLAFLIQSIFDTNLQSLPLVILFWFTVALLMSVINGPFDE
ncbi:MAG: O-antigen ligase family protein [Candidatus Omnitrophota bacterium]